MESENHKSVDELADKVREIAAIIHTDEFHEESHELERLADEIKTAWKQEKAEWEAAACACVSDAVMSGKVAVEHKPVGNVAALREALVELTDKVLDYLHKGLIQLPLPLEDATAKARAALSEPPRQCDVGTPEEQAERFRNFCKMDYISEDCPDDCPLYRKDCSTIRCPFAWAQTPYTEKGENNE